VVILNKHKFWHNEEEMARISVRAYLNEKLEQIAATRGDSENDQKSVYENDIVAKLAAMTNLKASVRADQQHILGDLLNAAFAMHNGDLNALSYKLLPIAAWINSCGK
jgi:uncharacterized protein (DUF342 family)